MNHFQSIEFDSLLSGDLEPAAEQALIDHLDQCAQCRAELESRSSDPEEWSESSKLLVEHPFDQLSSEIDFSPVGVEDVPPTGEPSVSPAIQHVLQSLGPTDDPEMLGRLGPYEVAGVVGAGGMGVVLKAFDRTLDRTVAIKVLAPHLACSGAARRRFAREAKAAAAVLHPNVIAIHGVSTGDDFVKLPYLVMPYLRGPSLQARIDAEGPLELEELLRVAIQIADGLAAAHARGLVHRDIKPANILLEAGTERVSITDFGLARTVDDATLTHSGVIAGTPQYMSPEQASGEVVDARSDLFSLGSLIYTMATGRPPFRAESPMAVMRRITDETARPVSQVRSDVPRWFDKLVAKLHAKDPSLRYETAGQLAENLNNCLNHLLAPSEPLPSELQDNRANKAWAALSSVGLVLLLVAAMIWSTFDDRDHVNEPALTSKTKAQMLKSQSAASEPDSVAPEVLPWDDTPEYSVDALRILLDSLDHRSRDPF